MQGVPKHTLSKEQIEEEENKKMTTTEVIGWLFDKKDCFSLPDRFHSKYYELEALYKFHFRKTFFYYPILNRNLNYYANDMFDGEKKPFLNIFIMIKIMIQQNNLGKYDLFPREFFIFRKNDKAEFAKLFTRKQLDDLGTGGFNSLYFYNKYNQVIGRNIGDKVIGSKEIINAKETKEESSKDLSKINELLKLEKNRNRVSSFLTELNQEVIDREKLTIFDCKKINDKELVLIFLDKNNTKRFFRQNIEYIIHISKYNDFKFNDYLMPFNPDYYDTYTIASASLLYDLKKSVARNFSRNQNFEF